MKILMKSEQIILINMMNGNIINHSLLFLYKINVYNLILCYNRYRGKECLYE